MPVSVQLDLVSGGQAEFQLPDPDPFPSSYFISMEHSGNGEFWSVAMKILGAANRSVCRFGESLQKAGITRRDVSRSAMRSLLQTNGYAFGMFREIDPGLMDLDLSDRNTFLFVRDPRDVVLSTYLATESKRSASAGATEESSAGDPDSSSLPILDFVRSAEVDNLARRYQRFAQFGGTARNVTVFRYEDVMFSWRQLVADLVDRLNLRISRESAFAIADSVPALADLSRLAAIGPRRWIPAFREYLDETSIADLEEKFAYPMAFFGYAPQGRPPAAFLDHQAEFLRAVSERFSIAHTQCLHLAVRAPRFGPQPQPGGVQANQLRLACQVIPLGAWREHRQGRLVRCFLVWWGPIRSCRGVLGLTHRASRRC